MFYKIITNPLSAVNILEETLLYLNRKELKVPSEISRHQGSYKFGWKTMGDLSNNNPNDIEERVYDMGIPSFEALLQRAKENTNISQIYDQVITSFLKREDIMDWSWYEVWEVIQEIIRRGSGGKDPDKKIKDISHKTALEIMGQHLQKKDLSFQEAVKVAAFANAMDMASTATRIAIEKGEFKLTDVLDMDRIQLVRDDTEFFEKRFNDGKKRVGMIFFDNAGEDVLVFKLIENQLKLGHKLILVGKEDYAANDSTAKDIKSLLKQKEIKYLIKGYEDQIRVISSGTIAYGLDLARLNPLFKKLWQNTDYFISQGQGNYYTTRRFKLTRPGLYILNIKVADELRLENGFKYKNKDFVAEFYDPDRSL